MRWSVWACRPPPPDGAGRLTLHTGVVYTRTRVDGIKKNTITWPDGRTFEGRWVRWHIGKYHPIVGTMTHPDGSVHEGTFLQGRPRSHGRLTRADGVRIECYWQGDAADGPVVATWPDGRRYKGAWHDGMCHGDGEMTFPDGSRWMGTWRDGRPHKGTAMAQDCVGCMACLAASPST